MSMFSPDRLKHLRETKQLKQADLANAFNMARSSYHNWETGKTKPNQKNLERLAVFFDVPVTYFESEFEIVDLYLRLKAENQIRLLNFAQQCLEEQVEEEQKVVSFPAYDVRRQIRLAAGAGFAFDDEFETETVYADQVQPNHDVAVWIEGDSMLPTFRSGEVALVNETGFDYDGAVYALSINGETVIKKVYREEEGIRLVSLNKKYRDRFVSADEDIVIVGKVVGHFMPITID